MNTTLSEPEMRDILAKGWYGHLGFIVDDKHPHVLPVAYAYNDGQIFGFAFQGEKTDSMRKNPNVCFQVEKLIDSTAWKSVVAYGTYEELTDAKEKGDAMNLLMQRLWDAGNQERPLYMPFRDSPQAMERAMADDGVVLYRISVTEMTGRAEQYE
jgi:hypothetical protein